MNQNNFKYQRKESSLNNEEKKDKEFIEEAKKELEKVSKDFNSINNVPGNFSNNSQKSDPSLETIYSHDRQRILYIYNLNNLYDSNNKSVKFSQNIIKIGFIDNTKFRKTKAYEVSDFNIQLTAEFSSNPQDNSTEYNMTHTKNIVFQDENFLNEYGLKVISIDEKLTQENIHNLYIVKNYNQPYSVDGIIYTKATGLQKLSEFKTRDGTSIVPILQKSIKNEKITKIKISFERSLLLGNFKALGKNKNSVIYSKTFINKEKIAFPMLSMPIEIQPKVKILQEWLSDQILQWSLVKDFYQEKSVLDLIKIESGNETRKQVIKNARVTRAFLGTTFSYDSTTRPTKWPVPDTQISEANAGNTVPSGQFPVTDKLFFAVGYGALLSNDWRQFVTTVETYSDVEVEISDTPAIDGLQKVLLNMLSYTYNYNRNFEGATLNTDPAKMNDMDKLRAKFVGQKPNEVITNLWNEWKLDNPDHVNSQQVKNFKKIVIMLSNYILCDLSINQGLNDDNRAWLPYFFELTSKPIHVNEGEIWKFEDVKVKLSSFYFNFIEENNKLIINVKNNELSSNPLLLLSENQYNWLSITNNLESNDIPSLLPKDITLSNGEFGKYFTRIIIDSSNIEKMLELYGTKNNFYSKLDWFKEISEINPNNDFEVILEDTLETLDRIEISGIFGQGNYTIVLTTDKNQEIIINNLILFSNNDESNSYINIEF